MIHPRTDQTASDVASHYDELDWVYRDIWGEHVHHGYWAKGGETPADAVEALVDLVADRLAVAPGERLCDIGCGYGATAARIAARHRASVSGFTISGEQAKQASARPDPDGLLSFQCRDWLENGLPDKSCDKAYAIESSEHMVDKQRFFDEAFRILRPDGRLVICAWLAKDEPSRWEVDHLLEPICREGRLPGMGSRADYEVMARRAGFRIDRFEDISRQVRKTWTICARRLLGRMLTDPAYIRLVASRSTRNRDFILSLPRLILAYRTGAMRYGLFSFRRIAD